MISPQSCLILQGEQMGLSAAISGGIMMVAFVMILMMLPPILENIFSVQEAGSSRSDHNDVISNTDISTRRLETQVGSSKVNFTLVNEGSENLWKFENFDMFVEYSVGSSKRTEELTYSGKCLDGVPQVRKWCIQTITDDFKDPNILNLGEGARIRTNLSQDLADTNVVITVVTDNGIINTSGYDFTIEEATLESLTNVTNSGCAVNQIIKVNSTGFWDCAGGVPVYLTSDVTCTSTVAYCTVFTIPLTPSSANMITAKLIADSTNGNNAVQIRGRATDAGATGSCYFDTLTTATGDNIDVIPVSTNPADTATTAWAAASNISVPMMVECTVEADATSPQNLILEIQQEAASTGTIHANSYYIKTP